MINRLSQNVDFHAQALMLRSERQRLIASNIANADTPGYVARDFDFTRALRDATSSRPGMGGPARQPGRFERAGTVAPRPDPGRR